MGRKAAAIHGSQEAAKAAGAGFFFTGAKCMRGHVAKRYTLTGGCVLCPVHESRSARPLMAPLMPRQRERGAARQAIRVVRRPAHAGSAYPLRDPVFRAARNRAKSLVSTAFKAKTAARIAATEELLGCTIAEFRAHIERQFLPGMSWANRTLWDVDHIVALSTARTLADLAALSRCSNLRPLWASDNIAKGAKRTHLL